MGSQNLFDSAKAIYEGMVKGDSGSFYGVPSTGDGHIPGSSGTGDGGPRRPDIPGREELLRYYDENVKGHSTRSFEDWLKEIANR
jgi:hypothetical protein